MTWVAAAIGSAALTGAAINAHQKNKLRKQQQKKADAIHPVDATYEESPEIRQQLALFQQLINSRAPGAAAEQNNIFTANSNALQNVNDTATSGAQAISLNSGVQGETNKALAGQETEAERYNREMLGGLAGATGAVADQEQKVYLDKVRKFDTDIAAKAALESAAIQNRMSMYNDFARAFSSSGQSFGSNMDGWPKRKDESTSPSYF